VGEALKVGGEGVGQGSAVAPAGTNRIRWAGWRPPRPQLLELPRTWAHGPSRAWVQDGCCPAGMNSP
jgi:hypothetical protein